jgi:hypothetical protein
MTLFEFFAAAAMTGIVATQLRHLAPIGFDVMMVVIVLTIRPVHMFMLILRGMVVRMRFVFGHNFVAAFDEARFYMAALRS